MDKKIDFEQLYKLLVDACYKLDVSKVNEKLAFEFHIKDMPEYIFYIEIKDGKISVAPYNYYDRNALVILGSETLYDIVTGAYNAKEAYAVGLIKVEGDKQAFLTLINL